MLQPVGYPQCILGDKFLPHLSAKSPCSAAGWQVVEEHSLGLSSIWEEQAEACSEVDGRAACADAAPFSTWKFRPGEASCRISDYIWCASRQH